MMSDKTTFETSVQDTESLDADGLHFFAEKDARQVAGRIVSTNFTYLMAGLNGIVSILHLRAILTRNHRCGHRCIDSIYPARVRHWPISNLLCVPHKLQRMAICITHKYPPLLEAGNRGHTGRRRVRPVIRIWPVVLEAAISAVYGGVFLHGHGSRISGCAVQHVHHHCQEFPSMAGHTACGVRGRNGHLSSDCEYNSRAHAVLALLLSHDLGSWGMQHDPSRLDVSERSVSAQCARCQRHRRGRAESHVDQQDRLDPQWFFLPLCRRGGNSWRYVCRPSPRLSTDVKQAGLSNSSFPYETASPAKWATSLLASGQASQ